LLINDNFHVKMHVYIENVIAFFDVYKSYSGKL